MDQSVRPSEGPPPTAGQEVGPAGFTLPDTSALTRPSADGLGGRDPSKPSAFTFGGERLRGLGEGLEGGAQEAERLTGLPGTALRQRLVGGALQGIGDIGKQSGGRRTRSRRRPRGRWAGAAHRGPLRHRPRAGRARPPWRPGWAPRTSTGRPPTAPSRRPGRPNRYPRWPAWPPTCWPRSLWWTTWRGCSSGAGRPDCGWAGPWWPASSRTPAWTRCAGPCGRARSL